MVNNNDKTVAPTSGVTKSASQMSSDRAKMLTESEFDFVNLVHQHYSVHGVLFTADYGLEQYGLPISQYKQFMKSDSVKKAIAERGVNLKAVYETEENSTNQSWRNLALTGQQILVADTMLDLLDNRNYRKKLQDLGVTTRQWTAWLKEPAFAQYLDENTQSVLKNGQHEAALAIMDGVSRGDFKFIQLYYEYTGRFVSKTNNATSGTSDAIDARRILQSVVEIIIDEVDDHQLASRIADRLKTLMTAVQVSHALIPGNDSGPVGLGLEKPEVVPNRVLTPAMSKAAEKGVGMET